MLPVSLLTEDVVGHAVVVRADALEQGPGLRQEMSPC